MNTKERLLAAINIAAPLEDYDANDNIFSMKYPTTSINMVYILQKLAEDFRFAINDEFVDALETCTFGQLEELLERYAGTLPA